MSTDWIFDGIKRLLSFIFRCSHGTGVVGLKGDTVGLELVTIMNGPGASITLFYFCIFQDFFLIKSLSSRIFPSV